MGEVQGTCDERFEPLEALLRANQDHGIDEGASLAVFHDGEMVVDLWAGTTDHERSQPWREDTVVFVFSTSKAMTTIAVLMLYDRGLLDLDAPIAEHWPEFAQHGKHAITARHVLTHRSGIPGFGRPVGFDEVHDWDRMIGILEGATPWYEPGTESYYHSWTFGFLLGELVHRVSGTPFAEFFRHEIAEPTGADFHFGISDAADQARVARLWYPAMTDDVPEEYLDVVMTEVEQGRPWNTPARMAAVIPSAGGIGNGRSIARIGAIMAMDGELDGRRYLSAATVAEAGTEQSYLEDRLLGPLRMGLGLAIDSDAFPAATPTARHWGGYGGSLVSIDPARRLSVGFAPNRLLLDADPTARVPMLNDRLTTLIRTIGEVSPALD